MNWPTWRTRLSGHLLGAVTSGGRTRLGVGDRFGTLSAPASLLGVVPLPVRQRVTRADGRSRLEWEDDALLFGLAAGRRSFRVQRGKSAIVSLEGEGAAVGGGKEGVFFSFGGGKSDGKSSGGGGGGKNKRQEKTTVTVEHERPAGGLAALLVPAFAMERANARWLLDLKKAIENKRKREARKK